MAPRWLQDGPKMAPRWPKMATGWPHHCPRRAQDVIRMGLKMNRVHVGPRGSAWSVAHSHHHLSANQTDHPEGNGQVAYLGIRRVPPESLMSLRRLTLPEFDVPRPLAPEQLRILSSWQLVLILTGPNQRMILHFLGQLQGGQFVILVVDLRMTLFSGVTFVV